MDTEEENCNDKVRECAKETHISHEKTESAIRSAKRVLRELEQLVGDEVHTETVTFNSVLLELRSVIDKHIRVSRFNTNGKDETCKTKNKKD